MEINREEHKMPKARGLRIDHQHLTAARNGDEAAIEHIFDRCHRYVSGWHASDLSEDARNDIVQEAVTDVLSSILHGEDHQKTVKKLKTALDRFKKREKRHQHRMMNEPNPEIAWAGIGPHLNIADFLVEVEHYIYIVGIIAHHMSHALEQLSDRDHDLIVTRYRLTSFGPEFQVQDHHHVVFSNDDTRRRALNRALERFEGYVRSGITAEINELTHVSTAPAHERVLNLQHALRLLDEPSLITILESVEDLEEVRKTLHPRAS